MPAQQTNRTSRRLVVGLYLALLSATAGAQEERLSLEWIFSDAGKAADATPHYAWISDNRLLIYDERAPKSGRTLEFVDAGNGRRRAAVRATDLLERLSTLLEPDEPLEEIGWPDAIGPRGRYVAYEHGGDVVIVDLGRSQVIPVAVTTAEERSPRFSPDGQWLAFVRDNDLHAYEIESGEEKRLTSDGSESLLNGTVSWVYWEELLNRTDRGYLWSPDSSAIAYLQTDESPVGVMHYVDFEPALPRVIKQRHPKPGSANPRVRAGVVRLADADTTWIDLGRYPHEYLARIKWLPDSRRLVVQTLNRDQTALDLYLAEGATGEARHLIRETDPGWVNVHDDLHFIDGGERFIWLSERDGHAHLYLYGLDGELQRQLTSGPWALRPSGGPPGMDQAVSFVDESRGVVYFTALEKASTERHLYRVSLDGGETERISAPDGIHQVRFAPGGSRYANRYSSLDVPPGFSVHDASGAKISEIAPPDAALNGRFGLRSWELFSVSARDGYELPAMMLKPRFFDETRQYPAIVYVYGGPSAPTVVNGWPGRARGYFHQLLADNGVVVFLVDNRSAAGRSKIDANSILRQLYGPVELDDLLDGVAWLKAQSYIDAERVGIWGWSGGGAMTLQAMTSSDEFAAGVAVAPVSDWRFYDTIYTERYMKRPQDNEAGYEETSHARRAARLAGRLLLVHGTYDDNVHPQNAWSFADGLIEAGITFDMMIYPMRKHGISDDAAQLHLYRTMFEFWQREFGLGD